MTHILERLAPEPTNPETVTADDLERFWVSRATWMAARRHALTEANGVEFIGSNHWTVLMSETHLGAAVIEALIALRALGVEHADAFARQWTVMSTGGDISDLIADSAHRLGLDLQPIIDAAKDLDHA